MNSGTQLSNILVPFDFSEEYMASLKFAAGISEKSGAQITLLHIYNPMELRSIDPLYGIIQPFFVPASIREKRLRQDLEQQLKSMGIDPKSVKYILKPGIVHNETVREARFKHYELIVIPDNHKTVMQRLQQELKAHDLMHQAGTAVLGVPLVNTSPGIKTIVVPIRNIKNWQAKIPIAIALAKFHNATILIQGIIDKRLTSTVTEIRQKVKACQKTMLYSNVKFVIDFSFSGSNPADAICNYSSHKHADLIIVNSNTRSTGLGAYFYKNFYNSVITKSSIPVMGIATH